MDPIIEDLKDEWDDTDNVSIDKVDLEENQDIANDYRVRSIPTIVVLCEDDDGTEEVFERFVGVTEEDKIDEAIVDAVDS